MTKERESENPSAPVPELSPEEQALFDRRDDSNYPMTMGQNRREAAGATPAQAARAEQAAAARQVFEAGAAERAAAREAREAEIKREQDARIMDAIKPPDSDDLAA